MRYLVAVLVGVIVLSSQVVYLFHDRQFFDDQFERFGSYERQPTVMEEATALMAYRRDDRVLINRDVYTIAEQEHLYDVKKILHRLVRLVIFCVLMVSILVFRGKTYVYKRGARVRGRAFFVVLGWFGLIALGMGLLAFFARDRLFDRFHRLLFVDNWIFPVESFLIQSYPWQFFRQALVVLFARTMITYLVVALGVTSLPYLRSYLRTGRE